MEVARRNRAHDKGVRDDGFVCAGAMGSLMIGAGVFWLALILLVIWLVVRLLPGGGTTRNNGESALEILDRRLANGQIDVEPWQA